jgi:uncharacterized protein (UPF0548 family)
MKRGDLVHLKYSVKFPKEEEVNIRKGDLALVIANLAQRCRVLINGRVYGFGKGTLEKHQCGNSTNDTCNKSEEDF